MRKILDACCGSRMFWFDKNNPLVDYVDIRKEKLEFSGNRICDVDPDIIADFRNLPFKNNKYKLVVFDPPHLKRAGNNSWLAKKYGRLFETWETDLKAGFDECMRVLDYDGILIFKWSSVQIPVNKIIELFGQTPLFGHKSGKLSNTHWMCFMKIKKNIDNIK